MAWDVDIEVTLARPPEISIELEQQKTIEIETATQVVISRVAPTYSGGYEFTPSAEKQTIPTEGQILDEDIVINPIPKNYGLITYNGFKLTVS